MGDQRARTTLLSACVAILLALGTLGVSASFESGLQKKSADLFDEIYERGRPIESSLRTLTASFVETSTSSLLADPIVSRGTLAVERPSRTVLNYTEPSVRRVLIDGSLLLVTWPSRGIKQQQNIGAAQERVQKYFVGKSPGELRRHFQIHAREATDRAATWHVDMVPTRSQLKEGVSRIELWLTHETVLPVSMRLTFPNGDTKRMDFSDVRVNPSLPPDIFAK
jgi:outer membrane lipoprotein-sorting protein